MACDKENEVESGTAGYMSDIDITSSTRGNFVAVHIDEQVSGHHIVAIVIDPATALTWSENLRTMAMLAAETQN